MIIAIDPDIEKSGYCVLNAEAREVMESGSLPFFAICCTVQKHKLIADGIGLQLEVYVEAGWLNEKSNFHPSQGRRAEKIAHDVGMNHAVGKLFLEYFSDNGISAHEFRPLKKIWRGPDRKITHSELESIMGQKLHRSNQDERDAILIAWVAANLPIKIQ